MIAFTLGFLCGVAAVAVYIYWQLVKMFEAEGMR